MILDELEVKERYESPLNLLNRLKSNLNHPRKSSTNNSIVSIPPTAAQVIDDLEDKLKFGSLKSKAAGIMTEALEELKGRMQEIKPEKLASVAESMNKIVTAQLDKEKDKVNANQIILYAPSFVSEQNFETIHVRE